jgi:hypothetical protein
MDSSKVLWTRVSDRLEFKYNRDGWLCFGISTNFYSLKCQLNPRPAFITSRPGLIGTMKAFEK